MCTDFSGDFDASIFRADKRNMYGGCIEELNHGKSPAGPMKIGGRSERPHAECT
jgi:hypothetical protein